MAKFYKLLLIMLLGATSIFNHVLPQEGGEHGEQAEGQGPEESPQPPEVLPTVPPAGPEVPVTTPAEPVSEAPGQPEAPGTTIPEVSAPTFAEGGQAEPTVAVTPVTAAAPLSPDVINDIGKGTVTADTLKNITPDQLADPANAKALANAVNTPDFQKIISSPSYTDALATFANNVINSLLTAVATTAYVTAVSLAVVLRIVLVIGTATVSEGIIDFIDIIMIRNQNALNNIISAGYSDRLPASTRADILDEAMAFIKVKAMSGTDLSFVNYAVTGFPTVLGGPSPLFAAFNKASRASEATVLKLAAKVGDNDAITSLLQTYHADPNVATTNDSALSLAAKMNNAQGMKLLIDAGANVNQSFSDGSTVFSKAIKSGSLDAVKLLMQNGVDPNRPTVMGEVPLMTAAIAKNADMINALIAAGANINQTLKDGSTVLSKAIQSGSPDTIKFLLQHGADPNLATRSGNTPLMLAANANKADVASALIDAGANVNEKTTTGATPLMVAAQARSLPTVTLLMQHGADPTLKTNSGKTALDYVNQSKTGAQAIIALLKQPQQQSTPSQAPTQPKPQPVAQAPAQGALP